MKKGAENQISAGSTLLNGSGRQQRFGAFTRGSRIPHFLSALICFDLEMGKTSSLQHLLRDCCAARQPPTHTHPHTPTCRDSISRDKPPRRGGAFLRILAGSEAGNTSDYRKNTKLM